jgi:hypothetical protein
MGEKNIVVNWGQPRTSPSGSNRGPHSDVPAGYGLSSRGDFLSQDLDNSDYISFWLQEMWAKEAEAAREKEAAAIIAAEVAKRDAEAAAHARHQAEMQAKALLAAEVARREAEAALRAAEQVAQERAQREAEEAVRLNAQREAKEAAQKKEEAEYLKHASDAGRLWSAVASPNAPTQTRPDAWEKASEVAKKMLLRKAAAALGKRLPILAAFYPADLASGERPSEIFSTPASELGVADVDLGFIADRKGTVDVTHRLAPDPHAQDGRLKWVKADGINYGSKVRVRPITYDSATNTYTFTRDGETVPTLTWTPQVRPENSSTHLPAAPQNSPAYTGAKPDYVLHETYALPEHTHEPDDYILELPAELGGSQYVYFKNRRDIPGIASGKGEPVSGIWLGEKTRNEGAPIPSQIADQLRGRRFSSFDRMREAIWEEVANDPVLNKDFTKQNLELMKKWRCAIPTQRRATGRTKKI